MQKILFLIGLCIIVLAVIWPIVSKLGLGRLPGDIFVKRGNFRLYFPIATSILISIVLSIFLWFVGKK